MPVCLLKDKILEFKKALKEKKIKIEDLLKMSTEARTELLKEYAGENAADVNLLFEQKLVLKNKELGIKNALSKVGEIGKYDPVKKVELEKALQEFKDKQAERIFSPKEEEAFLNSLADKKLGTHITQEQAKTIFDLTEKTKELKLKWDTSKEAGKQWSSALDKAQYGAAKVVLEKFTEGVKTGSTSLKDIFKGRVSEFKQTWEKSKPLAVFDLAKDTLKTISNNMISLVATLDNSFLGRQGLKTLNTHPTIWWNEMVKGSFRDIVKTLGGKNMEDALMADVFSSENYLNGYYEKAKLIPKTEEQFPTSLPGRIPGIGRLFKASEIAFRGSALRGRMKLFDWFFEKAKGNGVEISDALIKDIGKLTNSLTARGQGKITESEAVRMVMWAPRMLKANLDVLTAHGLGTGLETSFAKKQAGMNLLKIVVETSAVMMMANALKPGSAETDPLSSDFGKIKIGNTRFDITGGAGSIITLATRVYKNASKSSSTGIVSEYGTEFGQRSRWDALLDFLTNKTNPPTRIIMDLAKGETFQGKKATTETELFSATPIALQNIIQLKDNVSADAVLGVISDALGFSANTYRFEGGWSEKTTKEMTEFKAKIGDTNFKQASDKFNQEINKIIESDKFQKMSNEEKQKYLNKEKDTIKNGIFKAYNFQPTTTKSTTPKKSNWLK